VSSARIRVRVSPGAARSAVVGRHGDGWKVRVAAPPEGGRANDELRRHLASVLGLRPAEVTLVSGAGSRDKLVAIDGLTQAQADRLLAAASGTVLRTRPRR
jgi:hypothetical protein